MPKKTNKDEELPTAHYEGEFAEAVERYKPGPDERHVEVLVDFELTDHERRDLGLKIAEKTLEIESIEQEAKDAAAGFRARLKPLKKERREDAKELKRGKRDLVAQAIEVSHFPSNEKEVIFPHPGHPQARRIGEPTPLDPQDYQAPLLNVDAEAPTDPAPANDDEEGDKPAEAPRRGRGRPKGSKNKATSMTTHRPGMPIQ